MTPITFILIMSLPIGTVFHIAEPEGGFLHLVLCVAVTFTFIFGFFALLTLGVPA